MAYHRPDSVLVREGLIGPEDDSIFSDGGPEMPAAIAAALSGGPLAEAAEQNVIDESGCRDTSVPDTSPYACDPEWGSPPQTSTRPAIGEPDPNIEKVFSDEPTKATTPSKTEVERELLEWQTAQAQGAINQLNNHIATCRADVQASGERPIMTFGIRPTGVPFDDTIEELIREHFEAKDWEVEFEVGDGNLLALAVK